MREVAIVASVVLAAAGGGAVAQSSDAELAKQLSNPVAAMTSVPIQLNADRESPDAGPHGWGLRLVVTLLFPK